MAHYRKLLGAAVGLNTAIIVGEAVAGWQANSLSLLMDSIHNLSDEMALILLLLAFLLPTALSRTLLRSANTGVAQRFLQKRSYDSDGSSPAYYTRSFGGIILFTARLIRTVNANAIG
jgi:Cation efflux family